MFAGLLVSLSTLMVIAATSPVTYAVIAHLKLVLIMVGAVVLFKETMPFERLAGITLALAGLIWYSALRLQAIETPHATEEADILNQKRKPMLPDVDRADLIKATTSTADAAVAQP